MSGIFGVVSEKDCAKTLLFGTDYHSHLGSEFGGMAVLGKNFHRQIHNISQTQFKSKFYEDAERMTGNMGIGVISASEEQPMYLRSKIGEFCIVVNGSMENADELALSLMASGVSFAEFSKGKVNQTELAAKIISQGDNIVDGIERFFSVMKGACSLLLLSREGIYAARDMHGHSALIIGKNDKDWAVTTETTAFLNTGFHTMKDLSPGEIVLIGKNGLVPKRGGNADGKICSFLWIYTSFPASTFDGVNVELVRERSGRALAKHDKDIKADMVTGVPDSGTAHAIGYAMESGVPYRRPLVKYTPGYGRSYIPPSQEIRDHIATMKLVSIPEIAKGKRIVICEDSIVRGTQLKNFAIKKLVDGGAKELHVRPACPPLMYPCKYTQSTRTTEELVARRAIKSIEGKNISDVSEYLDHTSAKYKMMVDWIAKDIAVTSLRYQTVEDMVEAIGLPKEKLCLYCWMGETVTCCSSTGSCCSSVHGK